jgi:hypothetical protein
VTYARQAWDRIQIRAEYDGVPCGAQWILCLPRAGSAHAQRPDAARSTERMQSTLDAGR